MLESKKRMAQGFSELKLAVEKGKGDPQEVFDRFQQACQTFLAETTKLPEEPAQRFMALVAQLGDQVKTGNQEGILRAMEEIREMRKVCHETYNV